MDPKGKGITKERKAIVTDPRIVRMREARDAAKVLAAAEVALQKATARVSAAMDACSDVLELATSPAERALLEEVMGMIGGAPPRPV